MTNKQIEQINRLYLYFLSTRPNCDRGEYLGSETNQVLAFAEFAANADRKEIFIALPELKAMHWPRLQKNIEAAVNLYLLSHAKVLALA